MTTGNELAPLSRQVCVDPEERPAVASFEHACQSTTHTRMFTISRLVACAFASVPRKQHTSLAAALAPLFHAVSSLQRTGITSYQLHTFPIRVLGIAMPAVLRTFEFSDFYLPCPTGRSDFLQVQDALPAEPDAIAAVSGQIATLAVDRANSLHQKQTEALKGALSEREAQAIELQTRCDELLSDHVTLTDDLAAAHDTISRLEGEKAALAASVRTLAERIQKLEAFKRTLIASLQDDSPAVAAAGMSSTGGGAASGEKHPRLPHQKESGWCRRSLPMQSPHHCRSGHPLCTATLVRYHPQCFAMLHRQRHSSIWSLPPEHSYPVTA